MNALTVSTRRREALSDLDEITLARAQAGERSAKAALIQRYQRPVFALLSRMLGPDASVIDDLAQETFARVLGALPGFDRRGRARLVTWILTIATRLALDHLRAVGTHRDPSDVPGGVPITLPGPEQLANQRALRVALVEAVDALPPHFRAAFLLREVHELSYEEISEALGIDLGTVKSRLARARAFLQRILAEVAHE